MQQVHEQIIASKWPKLFPPQHILVLNYHSEYTTFSRKMTCLSMSVCDIKIAKLFFVLTLSCREKRSFNAS